MRPPLPHEQLDALWERYRTLPKQPLKIVGHMSSAMVEYEPLNMDGLLGWAVLQEVIGANHLNPQEGLWRVPVPLEVIYEQDGWPMYASTVLWPDAKAAKDSVIYHKRAQPGRYTGTKKGTFQIEATAGRWMDRRMPIPTLNTPTLTAWVIGNPEEVARLLKRITFIGRRRSAGHGEVRSWEIFDAPNLPLVIAKPEGPVLSRNIPVGLAEKYDLKMLEPPTRVAFTHPYHQPDMHVAGWRVGTLVG